MQPVPMRPGPACPARAAPSATVMAGPVSPDLAGEGTVSPSLSPRAAAGRGREAGHTDYRLSVDRRPTAVLPLPVHRLRIGRTADNDLVLSDLSISRHHAELRKTSDGKYQIVDLDSHNGTFVNGQRVSSVTLTEQDIVGIGHATFRLTDGELREYIDTGDVSLVAQDLVVEVSGGKILLDHVSFPLGRAVPGRHHRPERRRQVHPARCADRDASRRPGRRAVRQPRPVQGLRGAADPDRAGPAGQHHAHSAHHPGRPEVRRRAAFPARHDRPRAERPRRRGHDASWP